MSNNPQTIAHRRRGRPAGTNYRAVDRASHLKMRDLVERGLAPSLSAAARMVAPEALGENTSLESKVQRLLRSYPFKQ